MLTVRMPNGAALKRHAAGGVIIVRYADDSGLVFQYPAC